VAGHDAITPAWARARDRYRARRLHPAGIETLAAPAIPASGQTRQGGRTPAPRAGSGAVRGLRRCGHVVAAPRRRRPAKMQDHHPAAAPADPVPAIAFFTPKPPVPAGPTKMAVINANSHPAGNPGPRPFTGPHGRSDVDREAEPPCHLAAHGTATDLGVHGGAGRPAAVGTVAPGTSVRLKVGICGGGHGPGLVGLLWARRGYRRLTQSAVQRLRPGF